MRSTTPSGRTFRADDWIRTSMERFGHRQRGRPPPFSIEPRRQLKQECKDLNLVGRLWRPLPLPGGHPCTAPGLAAGDHWRKAYSRSVTFQYASLMNFDQLSIRMLWSA